MKRVTTLMASAALLLGLFAAAPSSVRATSFAPAVDVDHWVSKGGRLVSEGGGISCSRPGYRTIQGAADAAEPGDVIHVCRGTYYEHDIALPSDLTTGITIQGDGPNRTFIDALSRGRIFGNWNRTMSEGDIDMDDTAGLLQLAESNLRIADMTLRNGDAFDSDYDYSTGYDLDLGSPEPPENYGIIELLLAAGDHEVENIGGAILSLGRVECNNVRFNGNAAHAGGAVWAMFGVTANRCSFTNNSADQDGGAIWTAASVEDLGGAYSGNWASGFGGAVFASTVGGFFNAIVHSDASYLRSEFTDSRFSKNRSSGGGGAVAHEFGCVKVAGGLFSSNTTNGAGGAVYLNQGSFLVTDWTSGIGIGFPVDEVCDSEIAYTTFTSNSALSNGSLNVGGALAFFGGLDDDDSTGLPLEDDPSLGLEIYDTTFKSNAAALGGAIYLDDGIVVLDGGVSFNGNRARVVDIGEVRLGGYGSGVYAADYSQVWGPYSNDPLNRATFEDRFTIIHLNGHQKWYEDGYSY